MTTATAEKHILTESTGTRFGEPSDIVTCSCGWRDEWATQDGSAQAAGHDHKIAVDPAYSAEFEAKQRRFADEQKAEMRAKGCICRFEATIRVLDADCLVHQPAPSSVSASVARERCHDCSCHINPPCGSCENCLHGDDAAWCPLNCDDCMIHENDEILAFVTRLAEAMRERDDEPQEIEHYLALAAEVFGEPGIAQEYGVEDVQPTETTHPAQPTQEVRTVKQSQEHKHGRKPFVITHADGSEELAWFDGVLTALEQIEPTEMIRRARPEELIPSADEFRHAWIDHSDFQASSRHLEVQRDEVYGAQFDDFLAHVRTTAIQDAATIADERIITAGDGVYDTETGRRYDSIGDWLRTVGQA